MKNVLARRALHDVVFTDRSFAQKIINYFQPTGRVLDPCRGNGAFDIESGEWCEIDDGKDFHAWTDHVDWIITNPPWSSKVYRPIAQHAFDIADNVVFLIRLHNALGTTARHRDFIERGHALREIILCRWEDAGLPSEGFALGVFHWSRGWKGGTQWTYWNATLN